MAKQYDWFDISKEQRGEWEKLCPANEFRIIQPNQLPSIIPQALAQKFDSVLVVASGFSVDYVSYYMVNGNRVDTKTGEIDQMPFGLAFVGPITIPSGCLIQHGDWSNRTTKPPSDFWAYVSASGIGNCYPLLELPRSPSGSIKDLKIASQSEAFTDLVAKLKKYVDEESDEQSKE